MSNITAIIVDYNSTEFTRRAIQSLLEHDGELIKKIIVVDNFGLPDYSDLLEISDKVTILKPGKNLGFGKAINLAMHYVDTPYVLLQNPDTVLESSILDTLLSIIKTDSVGAITTMAKTPNGNEYLARRLTRPYDILAGRRSPLLHLKFFKKISERYRYIDKLNEKNIFEVEAFTGTFVLLKSDIMYKCKGFDTRFFLFMEDIDLSRRIRKSGHKILCYPNPLIEHFTGATRRKAPLKSGYLKAKSVYLYFHKWKEIEGISKLFVELLLGLYTIFVAFIDFIDIHRPEISWKRPLKEKHS